MKYSKKLTRSKGKWTNVMTEFYDEVYMELNGCNNVPENVRMDCTKICVANNILDEFISYYKNKKYSDQDIGYIILMNGPKVDEELKSDEVGIEDGFIVTE